MVAARTLPAIAVYLYEAPAFLGSAPSNRSFKQPKQCALLNLPLALYSVGKQNPLAGRGARTYNKHACTCISVPSKQGAASTYRGASVNQKGLKSNPLLLIVEAKVEDWVE